MSADYESLMDLGGMIAEAIRDHPPRLSERAQIATGVLQSLLTIGYRHDTEDDLIEIIRCSCRIADRMIRELNE